ncbi:hypothetical protein A986_02416, partial [Pseudomonas fluorescens BRIP34879]
MDESAGGAGVWGELGWADGWGIVEKTADYCRGRQVSDLKLTRVGFFGGVAYISVIWVTATGSRVSDFL